MSKAYCGAADKIPKGKHRGTMRECVETGQIRFFGVKKIDSRTLKGKNVEKKKAAEHLALLSKKAILSTKIKRLIKEFKLTHAGLSEQQPDKAKQVIEERKAKIRADYDKLVKEYNEVVAQLEK